MASCEWQAINSPSISYSTKKITGARELKEEDFLSKPGWINNRTGEMVINNDLINAILDYGFKSDQLHLPSSHRSMI